jgi:hypothetical protein
MKNSIPYAQAIRYRRIIEDDQLLEKEINTLKNNFRYRNYPENIVMDKINRINDITRSNTIQYKQTSQNMNSLNFTPFVLTFSNIYNNCGKENIYKIMKSVWDELTRGAPILIALPPPKIVFKKCQSIGSMLESSTFPPKWWSLNSNNIPKSIPPFVDNSQLQNNRPCHGNRCKCCSSMEETTTFRSEHYNKTFKVVQNSDCTSSNVIYLITCQICKLQYVGETGNSLRQRLRAHRHDIKANNLTPIGMHFNKTNHTFLDLNIIVIEILNTKTIYDRRSREFYWQLRLGTIFPKGLNYSLVDERVLEKNFSLSHNRNKN